MNSEHQDYSPKEAAEYLGLSVVTLCLKRRDGTGPKYGRSGKKKIFYPKQELDRWKKEKLFKSFEDELVS